MEPKDIKCELWREYDFGGRVYRIDEPLSVYIGNSTHRVVGNDGVVHCCPAPGFHGCILRWLARDLSKPVEF
jgi:hypothetical protein